ncbi:MaoC family dehydratase N-terminal domain-containing protein [Cumulibacter manganitolerans]|uniref:MaoC family dehydratase N-terminal domain-containing protein n=1 Tax=Cumulibacter manganitolerans TaxID=1884992 RepID=UPI0012969700|nr:MaoC family dehydratase N-terminal domain-containing protein [Cumulibacter manganitolerans]
MPLDSSFIGREYPPTAPYEVGREKIREFADAIGDEHPAYRDAEAARGLGHPDVIAPPTFAIVVAMPVVNQAAFDPELGLDYTKVVHGEQKFSYSRPITAGDRLVGVLHIDNIRSAAGNDILSVRAEVGTEAGEHVFTSTGMLVARGTAEEK